MNLLFDFFDILKQISHLLHFLNLPDGYLDNG